MDISAGLEIHGILVANATMFSHLLPGFSNVCYCHKFMVLLMHFCVIYTNNTIICLCLSTFANCRSQFLLDRLGRCLELIVSSRGTSCHEFASQFGLEFFYTRKNPKPDSPACCLFQCIDGSALRPDKQLNWKLQNRPSWVASR